MRYIGIPNAHTKQYVALRNFTIPGQQVPINGIGESFPPTNIKAGDILTMAYWPAVYAVNQAQFTLQFVAANGVIATVALMNVNDFRLKTQTVSTINTNQSAIRSKVHRIAAPSSLWDRIKAII